MRAAMEMGTRIPKLCATDMLDAFGSCRLCLVEIQGRNGTPASCTTPVAEGMVVHTQTDRLKRLRKGVMELYISEHPLDCLTCSANGDCELQDMAGAGPARGYGYDGHRHPNPGLDTSNPYFTYEPSSASSARAASAPAQCKAHSLWPPAAADPCVALAEQPFLDSECVSAAPASRPAPPRR
jgi:formate dehydrogenase major subunit